MTTISRPIQADPVITKLLDKVPADMRGSFTDEQLLALKIALGGRTWGAHAVDARWTLKWWRWQYYFVVLAGRNRRVLTDREQAIQRLGAAGYRYAQAHLDREVVLLRFDAEVVGLLSNGEIL